MFSAIDLHAGKARECLEMQLWNRELGDEQLLIEGIDELWTSSTPEAAEVLEAIGKHHPSKPVSKAARKALFKLRTSSKAR